MCKLILILILLMMILVVGCVPTTLTGSGNVVTQEEAISGFEEVDISHSFNATISQGNNHSVVIRVDDNLVEHLQVVKEGSTLKIGLKPNRDYTIRNATMEAQVIMPELTRLDLNSSSHATITGFKSTKDLSIGLSSSSSLQGDIEAGDVSFDISSSSDVTLNGSGQNGTINASSSSTIDLSGFPVVDAVINASSSSTATVNVSGRLDVDASSSSNVYYLGNPTLGEIDTSSGSFAEPK